MKRRVEIETKWTPGPWEIERGADDFLLITTGLKPGGYNEAVASVVRHSTHARMAGVRITPEQTVANARLIAAAADLYDALREFSNHYHAGVNPDLDAAYCAAIAALAKATG